MPILSLEDLKQKSTSVFTDHPHPSLSKEYTFLPTSAIVKEISDNSNWKPYKVMERRSIKNKGFQKHVVCFRQADDIKKFDEKKFDENSVFPEMLLVNSHDGVETLSIQAGIFRLVCENGLIVPDSIASNTHIKHIHVTMEEVLKGVQNLAENTSKIFEHMSEYRGIQLDQKQMKAFASAALEIRRKYYMSTIKSSDLLNVRRSEDNKNDLWTVFNRIQENLMVGGLPSKTATNRIIKTRSVRSIDCQLEMNKMLWEVCDGFRTGKVKETLKMLELN